MNKLFNCARFGHSLQRQHIPTYPRQSFFCSRSRSLWTANTTILKSSRRAASTQSTRISPQPWIERLPSHVRPYIYLTRIDKPIGTLLLFYPCGASFAMSMAFWPTEYCSISLVNYHGLVCTAAPVYDSFDLHQSFWTWGPRHAWRWMYHK
jgi:hypothetical protein